MSDQIDPPALAVSFVLETDNFASHEDKQLFSASFVSWVESTQLAAQQLALQAELIVVAEDTDTLTTLDTLVKPFTEAFPDSQVTVMAAPGSTYYDKKMLGALRASHRYVMFVDSDVMYSPEWFSIMATTLADKAPDVLYGETFALAGNARENSTAVVWQFPFHGVADSRRRGQPHRWSNNWAVKTEILHAHPIPRVAGNLKVEGQLWDRRVTEAGYAIDSCPATAFHRQPTSLTEWWSLAVRSGRAQVARRRLLNQSITPHLRGLVTARYLREACARVFSFARAPHAHAFSPVRATLLACARMGGLWWGTLSGLVSPHPSMSTDYSPK